MSKKFKTVEFTYGFDVEVPVYDVSKLSHTIVPAHLFIPYSKSDPFAIYKGSVTHWDNVALEVATRTYNGLSSEPMPWVNLADDIESLIHTALSMPSSTYSQGQLAARYFPAAKISGIMEEQYPELSVFGCDPDYNAYTGEKNPSPSIEQAKGLRAFSGHMHFGFVDPDAAGFDPKNKEHYHALCKAFDVFVGFRLKKAGLLSTTRMELYGKPGAFRYKRDYPGIEYRTPSNQWANPQHVSMMPGDMFNKVATRWKYFHDVPEYAKFASEVASVMEQHDSAIPPARMALIEELINCF